MELALGALLHVGRRNRRRAPFEASRLLQSLCRVFRDRVAVFLPLRRKRSCKLAVFLFLFFFFIGRQEKEIGGCANKTISVLEAGLNSETHQEVSILLIVSVSSSEWDAVLSLMGRTPPALPSDLPRSQLLSLVSTGYLPSPVITARRVFGSTKLWIKRTRISVLLSP